MFQESDRDQLIVDFMCTLKTLYNIQRQHFNHMIMGDVLIEEHTRVKKNQESTVKVPMVG